MNEESSVHYEEQEYEATVSSYKVYIHQPGCTIKPMQQI